MLIYFDVNQLQLIAFNSIFFFFFFFFFNSYSPIDGTVCWYWPLVHCRCSATLVLPVTRSACSAASLFRMCSWSNNLRTTCRHWFTVSVCIIQRFILPISQRFFFSSSFVLVLLLVRRTPWNTLTLTVTWLAFHSWSVFIHNRLVDIRQVPHTSKHTHTLSLLSLSLLLLIHLYDERIISPFLLASSSSSIRFQSEWRFHYSTHILAVCAILGSRHSLALSFSRLRILTVVTVHLWPGSQTQPLPTGSLTAEWPFCGSSNPLSIAIAPNCSTVQPFFYFLFFFNEAIARHPRWCRWWRSCVCMSAIQSNCHYFPNSSSHSHFRSAFTIRHCTRYMFIRPLDFDTRTLFAVFYLSFGSIQLFPRFAFRLHSKSCSPID